MRKICVFLRRDLQEKWRHRSDIEWFVCKKCQRRIQRDNPDNDMLEWYLDEKKLRNSPRTPRKHRFGESKSQQ